MKDHRTAGNPTTAGALVIALFAILGSGCGEAIAPGTTPQARGPAVAARVAEARLEPHPLRYEAVGTVRAEIAGTLAAKLMGTVTEVRVRQGDRVRQADALVLLDAGHASAGERQAEAAVAEARRAADAAAAGRSAAASGAELARATHARYQALLARESVSPQEFDEVAARFFQAQAALGQAADTAQAAAERVRQAEAALAAARLTRADATVRAPYDGVVTAKMVAAGDLAVPGRPLLGLEQEGAHRLDVFVPEAYADLVRPGQSVAVELTAAGPRAIEGQVRSVAPAADPASRTFQVQIRLPALPGVRSGTFARAAFVVGESRLIAVPASAVVSAGQLTGVFVLTAENIARFRLVRTGRRLGDAVEIVSGLAAGARYVVAPPAPLVDGTRVESAS